MALENNRDYKTADRRAVGIDQFPQQGTDLGFRCEVCFNYDTAKTCTGTIVRDDVEAPFVTIIRLDGGKFILGTECQYSPLWRAR